MSAKLDLYVEAGSTFKRTLTFKDAQGVATDLTGQTFKGEIRNLVSDAAALASFTFEPGALGEMTMILGAADSAGLPIAKQKDAVRINRFFAYDVERTFADGTTERVLTGTIEVSPEVTRG